jgi:hypothetical protein
MKPRPSAAIPFTNAKSSNSATTFGWRSCARNHVSKARRKAVFSAGVHHLPGYFLWHLLPLLAGQRSRE